MQLKLAGLGLIFLSVAATGQTNNRTCGMELARQQIAQRFPGAEAEMRQELEYNVNFAQQLMTANAAMKTTIAASAIPVVFHIVLTVAQQTSLGGADGIQQRVDSQLAVINRDFNRQNDDSSLIPPGFMPFYGNANVRFALAHRKPDGTATPGYEVITTAMPGFEQSGGAGSGMGFADGKYQNGAAISWDADRYLNIWVFSLLDNGKASSILGLTMPPSFSKYGVSKNELGIVLNYGAFGAKAPGIKYFISGITGGRTLTHELGHYFEVWHVWGDDNGKCVGSGGKDDGISDTPPQADATYGCPTFPAYDACTTSGNGIMFMNFMDYVNDGCMHMFTAQQAAVINSMTMAGKESYSLIQNPELTQWPTGIASVGNKETNFDLYPNPTTGRTEIVLTGGAKGLQVMDMTGRLIDNIVLSPGATTYTIDLSGKTKGVYIIRCVTDNGDTVKKLVLQ